MKIRHLIILQIGLSCLVTYNAKCQRDYNAIGTQIAITGESNPHGGYALVRVLDNQGQVTSTLLIGFYSKVRSNGIRYLSPVLPKGDYTVELEVTGEQSVWYDKSKNRFGSDDYFVTVRDILVMK